MLQEHADGSGQVLPAQFATLARCSAFEELGAATHALRTVSLEGLGPDERLALWINVYHLCILHGYISQAEALPSKGGSVLRIFRLHRSFTYHVGSLCLSAIEIEHCMLRASCGRPATLLGSSLFIPKFSPSDVRLRFAPPPADLLGFALAQGTSFSPPLRAYDAFEVHAQLQESTRTLLAARAALAQPSGTAPASLQLTMPIQFLWHQADLGVDTASALTRLQPLLPSSISAALATAREEGRRVEVRYARASWAACVEVVMQGAEVSTA